MIVLFKIARSPMIMKSRKGRYFITLTLIRDLAIYLSNNGSAARQNITVKNEEGVCLSKIIRYLKNNICPISISLIELSLCAFEISKYSSNPCPNHQIRFPIISRMLFYHVVLLAMNGFMNC